MTEEILCSPPGCANKTADASKTIPQEGGHSLETYRLKNIIIVILLLLNAFLLFLLLTQQYQEQTSKQALIQKTTALLAGNDIAIDPALLEENTPLLSYAYERRSETEDAFAAVFLGSETVKSDNGGNVRYESGRGRMILRPNGSFTLEMNSSVLPLSTPKDFVQETCPDHYRLAESGDTMVTAVPYAGGAPVYNAAIEFRFSGGCLASASGYFLPAETPAGTEIKQITRCSAAVSLMDDCITSGRICSTITAISEGYLLQSTASAPLLLTPVYRIETNTYSYYVNAATGHVSVIR